MLFEAFAIAFTSVGGYEIAQYFIGQRRRLKSFKKARYHADCNNKPLLVVGAPLAPGFSPARLLNSPHHPCGDITTDICEEKLKLYRNTMVADIRCLPFRDKAFGASYCSHVLEHLHTVKDAKIAIKELQRVADSAHIVVPSKLSIVEWVCPGHFLWLKENGNCKYIIKQRRRPLLTYLRDKHIIS